jgi:hypothetical protein
MKPGIEHSGALRLRRCRLTLRTTMQSKATTVQRYLPELPGDRRTAIEGVRAIILKKLDPVLRKACSMA